MDLSSLKAPTQFDDTMHYKVGCDASADPGDCIVTTPFTVTQAPSFARFTTTLPGESDSYGVLLTAESSTRSAY